VIAIGALPSVQQALSAEQSNIAGDLLQHNFDDNVLFSYSCTESSIKQLSPIDYNSNPS
jgi:hypothetical protein